jgi:hypothetical protein
MPICFRYLMRRIGMEGDGISWLMEGIRAGETIHLTHLPDDLVKMGQGETRRP